MQKFLSLSVLLVSAFIIIMGAESDVYAQAAPVVVRTAPAAAQVGVGQTVDLAIEVVSVQGIYGFDVMLSFDPNAVEVVDSDPNLPGVQVALGTFMDPGFMIINQADNAAGSLRVAMTQLNPSKAKSGTGNLVVVRFKGKQANINSEITLTSVKIVQSDGVKIPNSPISGQIQVMQDIPGPTNTGIPTRGAGTPMPTESMVTPVSNTATQQPTEPLPTITQPAPAATLAPTSASLPTATRRTGGGGGGGGGGGNQGGGTVPTATQTSGGGGQEPVIIIVTATPVPPSPTVPVVPTAPVDVAEVQPAVTALPTETPTAAIEAVLFTATPLPIGSKATYAPATADVSMPTVAPGKAGGAGKSGTEEFKIDAGVVIGAGGLLLGILIALAALRRRKRTE